MCYNCSREYALYFILNWFMVTAMSLFIFAGPMSLLIHKEKTQIGE